MTQLEPVIVPVWALPVAATEYIPVCPPSAYTYSVHQHGTTAECFIGTYPYCSTAQAHPPPMPCAKATPQKPHGGHEYRGGCGQGDFTARAEEHAEEEQSSFNLSSWLLGGGVLDFWHEQID